MCCRESSQGKKILLHFFHGIFTVFLLSNRLSCFFGCLLSCLLSRLLSSRSLACLHCLTLAWSLRIFLSFHYYQTNLQKKLWSSNLQFYGIDVTAQLNSWTHSFFLSNYNAVITPKRKQLAFRFVEPTENLATFMSFSCLAQFRLIVTAEQNKLFSC